MDERFDKIEALLANLTERLEKLESQKNNVSPRGTKSAARNIPFEQAWQECLNYAQTGVYPDMYLRKSGQFKNTCSGEPAVYYFNEDGEKTKITGEVPQILWHSLRSEKNKDKGHANSESKKKCLEKIKGVDVKKSSEVDKQAFDFLAGKTEGIISPTRALSPAKTKPSGEEIVYDDHIHYLHTHGDSKYIYEYAKNKNGNPNLKKTPTLRGSVKTSDYNKEDYLENINTSIDFNVLEKLKEDRKYFFDGEVVKVKKEILVPTLKVEKKEEEPETNEITEDAIDEILNGIEIE